MSSTDSDPARAETVVLIHGMWITPLSWEHWVGHYTDRGHHVLAPAWPGLEAEPEQLRRDPTPLRNLSITDVIDHYDKIIRGPDRPPIIIGHSFGGLYTQLLLDRGLGAAGVAMGTGAPKGVLRLPYSTIRAAWPALGNPANLKREAPLTLKQFHYGNPARPPLLLVTGTEDRISPPSVNKANLKKQRQAPTITEYKEYPGRCHFPGQAGWEEVADFALSWATEHSNRAVASPA